MSTILSTTISQIDTSLVREERKKTLQILAEAVFTKLQSEGEVKLNFICTHNSRRSHLAQVWANTFAQYFQLNISCFSGGTEATAVYPLVLEALKLQGFSVYELSRPSNSLFFVKTHPNAKPLLLFSKKYDDDYNPENDYIAVMTCADADANCPVVLGADKRFSLTYEDPKAYDNTSVALDKYLQRSTQIATELYFIFQTINALLQNEKA